MKFVKWFAYLLVGAVALAFAYLLVMPPELLRVGTNYTAKMVCSNVVLANRNPDEVLAVDVQAPGHPLLRLMRLNISEFEGTTIVRAGLLGVIAEGAAAGNTSSGCTNMPASMSDEQLFKAQMVPNRFAPAQTQLSADLQWPQGSAVDLEDNEQLNAILNDTQLVGPGMRAVVIVKDGRIIAERYGEGFNAETPLVGWSITKTVTAALIGRAVREGHMTLDDPIESFDWSGDERGQVRFTDLMGMASNLEWNESYGSVSDVTRMLFLENDMAGFVAAQPIDADQPNAIGKVFNYSSGTTVLLSRIWQDAIGNEVDAVAFPTKALFEPLGMTSAVKEMDASGTYVGS
ncbi:MAG: serine hydrolase, partial [Pseudomonadota bacterium]